MLDVDDAVWSCAIGNRYVRVVDDGVRVCGKVYEQADSNKHTHTHTHTHIHTPS